MLSAGVARSDITPPIGIGHAGWGAQVHQRAVGVDLPLWVTALAISDGREIFVIIDVDAMYLFEKEAAAVLDAVAKLTNLPETHIRLSYSHTHSGPLSGTAWSAWMQEGPEMIAAYDEGLQHKAAGVAWAAINALEPVRIGAGRGSSGIGVNRRLQQPEDGRVIVGRNPTGPIDPEVQVVRIDTIDGRPLATLVNYACHPITVGPDCDLITPDYPGAMKRVVEQATGSTCLFLQGAAGDIGPIRGGASGGIHEYRRLGAILGHEVSRIWWETEVPQRTERYIGTLESGAPLAMYSEQPAEEPDWFLRVCSRVTALPTREVGDPDTLAAEVAHHITELGRLRDHQASESVIREQTMLAKRTGMRESLARSVTHQPHRNVTFQGLALGPDIALIAIAAEPFSEIGRRVKDASPFPYTLFSGYSNVGWAYMPTADAYPLGGYEVEVSPFAPDAANQTIRASLEMLHKLRNGLIGDPDHDV